MAYDKKALLDFFDRWNGKGYEKGETQQFWLQALRSIGYPHLDDVIFEYHLPSGGFIDAWIRDADVLVEQKALGVDLDKEEVRQGKLKSPLEQALDYVDELPRSEQPRYVIVCNFETFRVYDRDEWSRSQLVGHAFEFTLKEFCEHPEYLSFINDPTNSRLQKEKVVSIKAGELIGELYDNLRKGYFEADSEESMHALNVLCVRLVFCLFCEDADLFEKDAFYKYLKDVPATGVRMALKRLFKALDTKIEDRDPYDMEIKQFPYVNGGLFCDETEIPNFTEDMKHFLLEDVSASVDWSHISPTIFGGIFESTLNPETRRSGGMHYTSPENIHKVIDPLFLNDLKKEFIAIRDEEGTTPRKRKNRLIKYHQKLCSLTFFDPACGSGNFLTETYICLRKLEDAVLAEIRGGQATMGIGGEAVVGDRIKLSQFCGIEINDFAVKVAETGLWISRLKANGETSMFIEMGDDDFPLQEAAHIVEGNALRMDWNEVLPASQCSFIMGNPPFLGSSIRSKEQTADLEAVYGKDKKWGKCDYCVGWYRKAADYMCGYRCHAALVSTNSITQGEQVQPTWERLFAMGIQIDFAWTTFVWNNEATDQAHVHCVIIGFSYAGVPQKVLFGADGSRRIVANINGYLVDAPNMFIPSRCAAIDAEHGQVVQGCKPVDGGGLILSPDEREAFQADYPELSDLIRPYVGSAEFLNDKRRYCLWLRDADPSRYEGNTEIARRLEIVSTQRQESPTEEFREYADMPHLFVQDRQPDSDYLLVPQVSSGRRVYAPVGYMPSTTIVSNAAYVIPNATLYDFGLISSLMHNAWMRTVAGRLKSDYRFSPVVYNVFAYPNATTEHRQNIEACAQVVLDARANHPEDSLATLYDPDKMPDDLLSAHKALDAAVEAAYGVDFGGDEEKIVAHLFKLYAEKIEEK